MILTKLHLENFKKYTSYDIEFGDGLVGIIGKNGSGKSTIFEAILFGLYGEAKRRGNKEILRNAASSTKDAVVVELGFEYENTTYKVIREFRGKTMSANAKLFKNGELTTTGAKEVTSTIVKLTGMSKDAFMHTLFASQKELTSLSTLKNEDRKKMIRRLLGLEKIDFIEKELIDRTRELGREIKTYAEVLLSDADIKAKQEQIQQNNYKNNALKLDELNKTNELKTLKKSEQSIKKELEIFAKTKEEKQKLFNDLKLLKNSITLENINKAKLLEELATLQNKQKTLENQIDIKKKYENTKNELIRLQKQKEYHLKREGLNKEQVQLREQYTKSKTDIYNLERECEMFEQFTFDAKNLEEELSIRQDNIEVKHTIEQELMLEMAAEQRVIDETNAKIDNIKNLGKESACPTCTRPLLEEYDNVINSLNQTVQNTHQKKIDSYNTQLKNVKEQKAKLIEQKNIKDKEYQELINKLNIIKTKQKDLTNAKEHFKLVELKGLKNKDELKALNGFNYDKTLHEQVQKEYDELIAKYNQVLALETELKRLDSVKADLAKVTKTIEELDAKHKAKEMEHDKVLYDENAHTQKKAQHEDILKTVEAQADTINKIKVHIASVSAEIKTVQNSLNNNDEQLKKVQIKKDDLTDYEKIKISLSSFKTKLNSKVAPRISTIASEMYSQITK